MYNNSSVCVVSQQYQSRRSTNLIVTTPSSLHYFIAYMHIAHNNARLSTRVDTKALILFYWLAWLKSLVGLFGALSIIISLPAYMLTAGATIKTGKNTAIHRLHTRE